MFRYVIVDRFYFDMKHFTHLKKSKNAHFCRFRDLYLTQKWGTWRADRNYQLVIHFNLFHLFETVFFEYYHPYKQVYTIATYLNRIYLIIKTNAQEIFLWNSFHHTKEIYIQGTISSNTVVLHPLYFTIVQIDTEGI